MDSASPVVVDYADDSLEQLLYQYGDSDVDEVKEDRIIDYVEEQYPIVKKEIDPIHTKMTAFATQTNAGISIFGKESSLDKEDRLHVVQKGLQQFGLIPLPDTIISQQEPFFSSIYFGESDQEKEILFAKYLMHQVCNQLHHNILWKSFLHKMLQFHGKEITPSIVTKLELAPSSIEQNISSRTNRVYTGRGVDAINFTLGPLYSLVIKDRNRVGVKISSRKSVVIMTLLNQIETDQLYLIKYNTTSEEEKEISLDSFQHVIPLYDTIGMLQMVQNKLRTQKLMIPLEEMIKSDDMYLHSKEDKFLIFTSDTLRMYICSYM